MALRTRLSSVLAFTTAALVGCDGLWFAKADPMAQAQAQPGETWLYSYSNDYGSNSSTLLMIQPVTGTAYAMGAPIQGYIDALAFDGNNRVLYGAWRSGNGPNAPSELVTIDWYTGAVTPIGPLTTTDPNTPSNAKVEGMTFAPDGSLLALTRAPQRLIEIEPTGDFHHLADLSFALHGYGAAFVGPTFYAVNATNNHLQVYEVDAVTGQGTRHLHQQPGGFSVGATSDDVGTFYAVFGSELHTLDAGFTRHLVADTGWNDLGALAWIEEPLNGIALEDACPCDADWNNHGEYVSCVAHWANEYATTEEEHGAIVSEAGQSDCGHKF